VARKHWLQAGFLQENNVGVAFWFARAPAFAAIYSAVIDSEEITLMHRELKTVNDTDGIPVLEIVKEGDSVTIYEADDMDRQIRFPVALLSSLAEHLTGLK
jgi:hypothetical protein